MDSIYMFMLRLVVVVAINMFLVLVWLVSGLFVHIRLVTVSIRAVIVLLSISLLRVV